MGRIKPIKTITLSQQDEESLTLLAEKMGLRWADKGCLSKLMERIAILARAYPDRFTFPTKFADYLCKRVHEGDLEAKELLEYLESWSIDRLWEEAVAEGVIKIKNNGGWIV